MIALFAITESLCKITNMTSELKSLLLADDPVAELRDLHASGNLETFEKSLADLKMEIPKGYHHKDNLEHSLRVLQNAIDREEDGKDLILRSAALFHDIGKPATRKFHEKGKVTFTFHDRVGAKMARKIFKKHGYTKQDTEDISRLIAMHMQSHSFSAGWNESAVRRLSTSAGSDLQLDRLIKVFYSDTTTTNLRKMNGILKGIDALAAELERVKAKDARAALRPALNGLEVGELLGLKPGPELGRFMKFLNTDEMIRMDREAAVAALLDFAKKV